VAAKCRSARRREHAIHLLGKRLRHVAGAEPGFHVTDRNARIKRGQRAAECAGGIALNQRHIGLLGFEDSFKRRQNAGGGLKQGLARQYEIQIAIRPDVEYGQHFVEHTTMLTGDADRSLEFRRPGA
jgi:hypothetical protein